MTKQGAKTLMPIITVDSIDEVHNFYTEKLGFKRVMGMVGKDGQFDFVSYDLNGAQIMFTRAREPMDAARPCAGRRPVDLYLEVDDVDAYYRAITQHGVRLLTTQWWGDRTFTVVDPYGYQIWFHQKQVAEMKPPQGAKLV